MEACEYCGEENIAVKAFDESGTQLTKRECGAHFGSLAGAVRCPIPLDDTDAFRRIRKPAFLPSTLIPAPAITEEVPKSGRYGNGSVTVEVPLSPVVCGPESMDLEASFRPAGRSMTSGRVSSLARSRRTPGDQTGRAYLTRIASRPHAPLYTSDSPEQRMTKVQ